MQEDNQLDDYGTNLTNCAIIITKNGIGASIHGIYYLARATGLTIDMESKTENIHGQKRVEL